MSRSTRRSKPRKTTTAVEVPMRGRRSRESAANSLQFFARIEGENAVDALGAHIRGANGIRWRMP